MFNLSSWFSSSPSTVRGSGLTVAQKKMYSLEQSDNFRWAAKAFALHSSHKLTSTSLAPPHLQLLLSEFGQFAEVALGLLRPKFIWKHLDQLTKQGFPLQGYNALKGSELVNVFKGKAADLQGYTAYRRSEKQLVISFSGTSSIQQALQDVTIFSTPHPGCRGATLHLGFWKLYCGVRDRAFDAIRKALDKYDNGRPGHGVKEIVVCGHSMGGAVSYLFAIDLLAAKNPGFGKPVKVAVFGCPRIGNEKLANYWRNLVSSSSVKVEEYSVRSYNDGVTSLPPHFLGFRHLCASPLYAFHGALFYIPPSESECCHFNVDPLPNTSGQLQFPRGGHNYYNARDMEKLVRRMGWLELDKYGEGSGWEDRYLKTRNKKEM